MSELPLILTISDARRDLKKVIYAVNNGKEYAVITLKGDPELVCVAPDTWNAIQRKLARQDDADLGGG